MEHKHVTIPIGEQMKNLWEVSHPYYCSAPPDHKQYQSVSEFLLEFGDADPDRHYLVRWDWLDSTDPNNEIDNDELVLHFLLQSKTVLLTVVVNVKKSDQDTVRDYLNQQHDYVKQVWSFD